MNTKKSETKDGLIGAGILTAIASSLCCLTPLFALIAGSSGFASIFSWLEPARPYLIGITVLVIGFAWYQKLKPKKAEIECNCEGDEKKSFWQTKTFLGIVTVFASLMLTFPYYSHIFYPTTKSKVLIIESNNIAEANFDIEGMTCTGCEEHIKHAAAQLPGFIEAVANHETGKANVKFDKSKSSLAQVIAAINETGYKVAHQEIIQN